MTQKEKLEAECQNFQALAMGEGLSAANALRTVAVLDLAGKLMWSPSVEEALKLMRSQPDAARAFWYAMNIVVARIRDDKVRPGVPPMKANGPLSVLAASVLDYCEALDEGLPENF